MGLISIMAFNRMFTSVTVELYLSDINQVTPDDYAVKIHFPKEFYARFK